METWLVGWIARSMMDGWIHGWLDGCMARCWTYDLEGWIFG